MMLFFESLSRHIKLYIYLRNKACRVGTLLETNIWLALVHLGTLSKILSASLYATWSFFILALEYLHHK